MADFQSHTEMHSLGVRVVAASVDSVDDTAALTEKLGLDRIEMASKVDAVDAAASLGAYLDTTGDPFFQPTAFVLNPDGEVVQSLYSSAALGRLSPDDLVKLVTANTAD